MSFTFSIAVKQDGTYRTVDGVSVVPFAFSTLLDERLDEAHVTIHNSSKADAFQPYTDVRINVTQRIGQSTKSQRYYFVVSRDDVTNVPNGSDKFTHDIQLIERTKLLETVVCQSIAFTNAKEGTTIYSIPLSASRGTASKYVPAKGLQYFGKLNRFIRSGYTLPSINEIGLQYVKSINNAYFPIVETGTSPNKTQSEVRIYQWQNGVKVYLGQYPEPGEGTPDDLDHRFTITDGSWFATIDGKKKDITIEYCVAYGSSYLTGVDYFIIDYDGIEFTDTPYTIKEWTLDEAVDRVLQLAEPVFVEDKAQIVTRFTLDSATRANIKDIKCPEIALTQCTLREQLKSIAAIFHAEPRLSSSDAISFEPYVTGEEETRLDGISNAYKANTWDINGYATRVISHAANLVNSTKDGATVTDPIKNGNRSIRSETAAVRINEENGIIALQYPIYDIKKVICCVYNIDGTIAGNFDITDRVVEKFFYDTQLSNYHEGASKDEHLYFERGRNIIGGLFYQSPTAMVSVVPPFAIEVIVGDLTPAQIPLLSFNVEYVPIYDAMVSHGKPYDENKQDAEIIFNQSENIIETQYLGRHLRGLAKRIGNMDKKETYYLDSIDNIPRVGYNKDGYIISAVLVEFYTRYIKCTVEFTKDFNRLSQYISIPSQKRLYQVSEHQAYERNILLREKIKVSRREMAGEYSLDEIAKRGIFNAFEGIREIFTNNRQNRKITAVTAWGGTWENPLIKTVGGANEYPITGVTLPVASSALGNAFTFSWRYSDNYSAGKYSQKNAYSDGSAIVSGYWSTDVPYSDYFGRAYFYNFVLRSTIQGLGSENALALPKAAEEIDGIIAETSVGGISNIARGGVFGESGVGQYLMRKDSREVLTFTLEEEIVSTTKDLNVLPALSSMCLLVSDEVTIRGLPKFYVFEENISDDTETITGMTAVQNTDLANPEIIYTAGEREIGFCIQMPEVTASGASWAIAFPITSETVREMDEKGNITETVKEKGGEVLLSSNTVPQVGQSYGYIYFTR